MGHYDAPIGNEIAAGLLEPVLVLVFEVVMLFSVIGGKRRIFTEIAEDKQKFFYVMVNLCHAALAALCYTNDIFTAYVFVEICTIASCSLLMANDKGKSLIAATRYMIFSLIGSGFLLIGIILLYSVTGHLLFANLHEAISILHSTGEYDFPITVAIGLIVSGICVKSGLFPFHFWMPDTYGTATPTASAILSGVISKGYIFLLFKIIFRVVGYGVFYETGVQNLLFIFDIHGMILGSVSAMCAKNVKFMIAYSSAAQIGYIYMGIGLGTRTAIVAAIFQIIAHSLTKSMLFISAGGLCDTAGGKQDLVSIRSAAHKNKFAGAAFLAGSLSMIGVPLLAGFVPKLLFASAAIEHNEKMFIVLVALAVSTMLNVMYFMRTSLTVYHPLEKGSVVVKPQIYRSFAVCAIIFIVLNVCVGVCAKPITSLLEKGLELFINVR
jgi:multicomponent Na+:H+ antiporter subunit D